eukprot:CAMPEP_0202039522 /NCGR_PEP_ID=MMETSP0962-20130828/16634_1 /ASSEMBLY_ACC=CAM_ASM_000488 /TAXON_ID=4773 /ORGANISM="Schizochytrium aggregatum, Strain ATCC28209" /LENGTH=72 /DNA_ID=CAMNT_0048603741 /DNA_START=103 /DNA_END=318 /DNA_ORIENTATION=+
MTDSNQATRSGPASVGAQLSAARTSLLAASLPSAGAAGTVQACCCLKPVAWQAGSPAFQLTSSLEQRSQSPT